MSFGDLLKNIKNNNLDTVKYLVSQGVDITSEDDYAVRLAGYNGNLEIVKYLVSQGADIRKMNDNHKCIIYGTKILECYRRQKNKKIEKRSLRC
jgi:ankyrin repeat protein